MKRGLVVVAIALVAACAELRVAEVNDAGAPTTPDADTVVVTLPDGGTVVVPIDAAAADVDAPPTSCDGPCTFETLATGLVQATTITVDDANVYFAVESGAGTIYQCPKTGCSGAPLVLGTGNASSIVVAGGIVYWPDYFNGAIHGCNVGGCEQPKSIVSNESFLRALGYDGTHLVWIGGSALRRCPRTACNTLTTQTLTTTNVDGTSIAVGGTFAFWAAPFIQKLYRCANLEGCTPQEVGPGSHDVSTDGKDVFWVDGVGKAVLTCPIANCSAPNVRKIGSSSAALRPVSDGTHVYWYESTRTRLVRCPVTGCAPEPVVIADDQRTQPAMGIALDAEYIYWTTTSAVRRMRKQ
ncbi:MAG: hypothetical protein KIT84_39145 [Labilithrix sp.]|nr:hypothetical protein [Labilithrix sp.]MCW5817079.1 hypothetical protein [Labilithrix sp.]